ncbi:HD domain-containing protein [Salinactinospora qingdaonensis]|uniref:Metal-dependent HD superfamily phosphohydrolase n=1 Tax=Salinactinospora qingdaonensis TaxID=702744 RepID=A0ABP7FD82_9ACTN
MSRIGPDLAARWRELAGNGIEASTVEAELLARWTQPHRRYHTLGHLHAVLTAVDELAPEATDIATVRYAAWFHDVVYEGNPGVDEELSARLAQCLLPGCGLTAQRAAAVAALVRVTAGHRPAAGDRDAQVLCDADLAVLGSAPGHYGAYAAAVRQEYGDLSEADFRSGRARLLRSLLSRSWLFHTAPARSWWEEQARANMAGELAVLAQAPARAVG